MMISLVYLQLIDGQISDSFFKILAPSENARRKIEWREPVLIAQIKVELFSLIRVVLTRLKLIKLKRLTVD